MQNYFIDGQFSQTARESSSLAFGTVTLEPFLQPARPHTDHSFFHGVIKEGNMAESYIIDADRKKAEVHDFSLQASGHLSFKKKYPGHLYFLHYEMMLGSDGVYEGTWETGDRHHKLPLSDGEGRAACVLRLIPNRLSHA